MSIVSLGEANGVKRMTAVFILVGAITTGVVWMETRYAKAADLGQARKENQQALSEVKVLILKSQRENARSRAFELEQRQLTKPPLTPIEIQRLRELRDEIIDLSAEIKKVESKE